MVEIETTKMSSKGQVVIPFSFRKNIKEGDTLIVLKNREQIILKPASSMDKQFAEDFIVAKRVEAAWKEIDEGKYKRMSAEDFLKEIRNLK